MFPKWWSTLQTTLGASQHFTSTAANSMQWPPSPSGTIQKVTIFFYNYSPRPLPLMKAGKAHAVCLSPREDCIFYLSPLGFIFTVNSWLKCNQPRNPPYVLSCHSSLLTSRVKHRGGKKNPRHGQPSHKTPQTLVCYTENPETGFHPFQLGRKQTTLSPTTQIGVT